MAVVHKLNFLKSKAGFTLLELILVIVILGILAGLIYPAAAEIIDKQKLHSTAKEIMSDMRRAQQLAIAKETTFRLIFNHTLNKYFIKDVIANKTIKEVALPKGIIFYHSKIIEFFPNGTTQNETITLQNGRKQNLFIVTFMTGRMRITEIEP